MSLFPGNPSGVKLGFLLAVACIAPCLADTRVTVAADGSGQYTKLQDALNAVPANNSTPYIIDIKPGTYSVPTSALADQFMADSPKIILNGLGATSSDVVITGAIVASASPNDKYQHATIIVIGSDFTAKNVTFANTAGTNAGQALAIYSKADRLAFVNCRFLGWQDTLRAEYGRQSFENCYVEGDVDFIYGHATGYFKNCSLYVKENGYVTAPDLLTPAGDYRSKGLVFQSCTITGVTNNTGLFGRPWNDGGLAVFLNTKVGPVLKSAGWGGSAGQTAYFGEYKSTDLNGNLLNVSGRVAWSVQLTDAQVPTYSQTNWLSGPDSWVPVSPGATPAGLTATANGTQVNLNWTAASGTLSYNIKRATTSGGPYTTIATSLTNSYVNAGLVAGTTYYYVVSATGTGGEGSNSSQSSATLSLPVVTIAATDASAGEYGADQSLSFTVTRSGVTTAALTVPLADSGSATAGADYSGFSGSVTIPIGQANAAVPLTVLADALAEGPETVTLALGVSGNFTAGSPSSATADIADNPSQDYYFTKIADPAKRGPLDDADSDTNANAIEYFMFTDPGSGASRGALEISATGPGIFKIRYPRAKNRADVNGTLQWSADVADWFASGQSDGTRSVTFSETVVSPSGADPETVEATAIVTGPGTSRIFVRLGVR